MDGFVIPDDAEANDFFGLYKTPVMSTSTHKEIMNVGLKVTDRLISFFRGNYISCGSFEERRVDALGHHYDYIFYHIFKTKGQIEEGEKYYRVYFDWHRSYQQERDEEFVPFDIPEKVLWTMEELVLNMEQVESVEDDWMRHVRSDLIRSIYVINHCHIVSYQGIVVRPGMSGIYFIRRIKRESCPGAAVYVPLKVLGPEVDGMLFPVSSNIAEITSLGPQGIIDWQRQLHAVITDPQDTMHDLYLLRTALASSFQSAMGSAFGSGRRKAHRTISFSLSWNSNSVFLFFLDLSIRDIGFFLKKKSLGGPSVQFWNGSGMPKFGSDLLGIGKRIGDVDQLADTLGSHWWAAPNLSTTAQLSKREGNLENTLYTTISRDPCHNIEIMYDLLHGTLKVRAHVTHFQTHAFVLNVKAELDAELQEARVNLLGVWKLAEGDHGLGGKEVKIYHVERNSHEFTSPANRLQSMILAWGYLADNQEILDVGWVCGEADLLYSTPYRDIHAKAFSMRDFQFEVLNPEGGVDSPRLLDGSCCYPKAKRSKRRRSKPITKGGASASDGGLRATDDDDTSSPAAVPTAGESEDLLFRRVEEEHHCGSNYGLRNYRGTYGLSGIGSDSDESDTTSKYAQRHAARKAAVAAVWEKKFAFMATRWEQIAQHHSGSTTWTQTFCTFDQFLGDGVGMDDKTEKGLANRFVRHFDYGKGTYPEEDLLVCVEIAFELSLNRAGLPINHGRFLNQVAWYIVRQINETTDTYLDDESRSGDEWYDAVHLLVLSQIVTE